MGCAVGTVSTAEGAGNTGVVAAGPGGDTLGPDGDIADDEGGPVDMPILSGTGEPVPGMVAVGAVDGGVVCMDAGAGAGTDALGTSAFPAPDDGATGTACTGCLAG